MPINAWQQVQDNLINIVTTVPSWLEILLEAGDRLKNNKGALKQILVTGSQLKSQIRDKFSAITGITIEGVDDILEAIINRLPAPTGLTDDKLKSLLVESWYDSYLGVVILVRVINGKIKKKYED